AEWNFNPIPGDPTRILDEHWCMSPYYTERDDYYKLPTYPLRGIHIGLQNYQNSPLENWAKGALNFNGKDQYAVLTNSDIALAIPIDARGRIGNLKHTSLGAEVSSPQIYTSDFLLEVYFRTAPAQKEANLIQKINDVGWSLA